MTRYFYSDALAAAWMAKHFGMRLYFGDRESQVLEVCDFTDPYDDGGYAPPYHIHPESLLILEPRDGDLAMDRNGNVTRVESAPVDKLIGAVTRRVILFGGYFEDLSRIERVLERDGKAFHAPESEAA